MCQQKKGKNKMKRNASKKNKHRKMKRNASKRNERHGRSRHRPTGVFELVKLILRAEGRNHCCLLFFARTGVKQAAITPLPLVTSHSSHPYEGCDPTAPMHTHKFSRTTTLTDIRVVPCNRHKPQFTDQPVPIGRCLSRELSPAGGRAVGRSFQMVLGSPPLFCWVVPLFPSPFGWSYNSPLFCWVVLPSFSSFG